MLDILRVKGDLEACAPQVQSVLGEWELGEGSARLSKALLQHNQKGQWIGSGVLSQESELSVLWQPSGKCFRPEHKACLKTAGLEGVKLPFRKVKGGDWEFAFGLEAEISNFIQCYKEKAHLNNKTPVQARDKNRQSEVIKKGI